MYLVICYNITWECAFIVLVNNCNTPVKLLVPADNLTLTIIDQIVVRHQS